MPEDIRITVDELPVLVTEPADTPLFYVLTNELHLQGPRFGCGVGQCGGCSVLVNDVEMRSCILPVAKVNGKSITTLEGLPRWYAKKNKQTSPPELHPVQQAIIDEQAIQCGYCYNGMVIKAAELLAGNSKPTEAEIRRAMRGHLCRCGTYPRMMKAIHRAAIVMSSGKRTGVAR